MLLIFMYSNLNIFRCNSHQNVKTSKILLWSLWKDKEDMGKDNFNHLMTKKNSLILWSQPAESPQVSGTHQIVSHVHQILSADHHKLELSSFWWINLIVFRAQPRQFAIWCAFRGSVQLYKLSNCHLDDDQRISL